MNWPSWTAASASCSCAASRPFLSDKYDLTQHPNYKLTGDYDKKNMFDIEKYLDRHLKLKPSDTYDVMDADTLSPMNP